MRGEQTLSGFTGCKVGQGLHENTKWFYEKRWDKL